MRRYDSPFLADWFAITLRWLAVWAFALSPQGLLGWAGLLILALWAAWNLVLSILAGLNRRFVRHREISILVDGLLGVAWFVVQGGIFGPYWWAGLVALLSAGIYFELRGALITALVFSILQAGLFFLTLPPMPALLFAAVLLVFNLLLGALFGRLGYNLFSALRRRYQARLAAEAEKRRRENERLHMVYKLSTTLTSTLSYRHVLESILNLAAAALEPDDEIKVHNELIGAVLLFQDGELKVASGSGLTAADQNVSLPGIQGILAQAIESGDPVIVPSVVNDPELSRLVALHSRRAIYIFPLRLGFDVFGVLLFAHPEPDFFNDERREMLDILGRQAVIAIKNAKLYEDLLEEKEHIAQVQEEARNKLARDLHDGPTQSVSAIAMRLNFIRMMLERKPEGVPDELAKLEDLARRTTKELRHMLFTLRPLVLETQGLTAALETMAAKMRDTYGQEVIIQVEKHLEEILEINKQGVIFFIAEEAVNNARKHAKAAHIWVNLRDLGRDIALLEIADDGVGFDLKTVMGTYETRGSLGMINLQERSALVNGLLHIDSAPGKGTRVQVFIPLSEEAADRLHHARQE